MLELLYNSFGNFCLKFILKNFKKDNDKGFLEIDFLFILNY